MEKIVVAINKASVASTEPTRTKIGSKERERNKVLFRSKLYEFVGILFIFK
jgi:hypothetical protein